MIGPESAFDIAASGMAAQRMQMDLIADNLANANTSRIGAPFHARAAVFETASPFAPALDSESLDAFAVSFDDEPQVAGVRLAGLTDASEQAVDPVSQMVGLVASGRAYDADIAVLQAAKQMEIEAVDIERA